MQVLPSPNCASSCRLLQSIGLVLHSYCHWHTDRQDGKRHLWLQPNSVGEDQLVASAIDIHNVLVAFHCAAEAPGVVGRIAGAVEVIAADLNGRGGFFPGSARRHVITTGVSANAIRSIIRPNLLGTCLPDS